MRKKALLIAVFATLAVLLVLPASALAYAMVWKTPGAGDYGPDLTRVADVQVTYTSGDPTLHVTLTALPGYQFLETQMVVGCWVDDAYHIPQNQGGPIPGRFPLNDTWPSDPPKTSVTYDYNVAHLLYPWQYDAPNLTVLLHAVVMRADGTIETAWGTECWADYYSFPGKNWARWLPYPAWN